MFSVFSTISVAVKISTHKSSILEAVNYNGLLYFVLANLLTGSVNLLMDTLSRTSHESLAILTAYLFVLNTSVYILYRLKVRTKFW